LEGIRSKGKTAGPDIRIGGDMDVTVTFRYCSLVGGIVFAAVYVVRNGAGVRGGGAGNLKKKLEVRP